MEKESSQYLATNSHLAYCVFSTIGVFSTVAEIMSTVEGYLKYHGGHHDQSGEYIVQYHDGYHLLLFDTPHDTHDIPHMYHDTPHGTEHPPRYSRYPLTRYS